MAGTARRRTADHSGAGGLFVLGMGYGIYVQSLGLPVWMPMLMGTVVYGGSLEFVLASLLLSAFSPFRPF